MCAPVSSNTKTSYNEKEFNGERPKVDKDNMEVKGSLLEKEDIAIYSISERSLDSYSNDLLGMYSVSLLEDPPTLEEEWADKGYTPPLDEEEKKDDDLLAGAKEGESPTGEPEAEVTDEEEVVSEEVEKTVEEMVDGDEEIVDGSTEQTADGAKENGDDSNPANGTGSATTVISLRPKNEPKTKVESDNKKTTMNNEAVNKFENFTAKSKDENIRSNISSYFKQKVEYDLNRLRHPFKAFAEDFKRGAWQITHLGEAFVDKFKSDLRKFEFLGHQQEDPAMKYRDSDIQGSVISNIKETIAEAQGKRDEIQAKIDDAQSGRSSNPYAGLNKEQLNQAYQQTIDAIKAKSEEIKQIAIDNEAATKRILGDKSYENATKAERKEIYAAHDHSSDTKQAERDKLSDNLDLIKEAQAGIKSDSKLEAERDKIDAYINELKTQATLYANDNYVPSIQDLKQTEDLVNAGTKFGLDGSHNVKSPDRIRIVDGVAGAEGFLKSAVEYNVRNVEEHKIDLEDKIAKMEDFSISESNLSLLETCAQACSLIEDWGMSDIVNSFQVRDVIPDINDDRKELFELKDEMKEPMKEISAERKEFLDSHDMKNLTDEEYLEYKELNDKFQEMKEVLSEVNSINSSFKSKKEKEKASMFQE